MNQKTALIISAGATAFMLFTAGAVIRATSQPQTVAAQAASTVAPVATIAAPATSVTAQQYTQLINEANARIQQLKYENAMLQLQAGQTTAGSAASVSNAPAASQITADAAAQVALNVAPGTQLMSTPELVNFQGTTAFEVVLNTGSVYIDAGSGQLLYSAATQQQQQNLTSFEQGEHHEEHEDHEDHD